MMMRPFSAVKLLNFIPTIITTNHLNYIWTGSSFHLQHSFLGPFVLTLCYVSVHPSFFLDFSAKVRLGFSNVGLWILVILGAGTPRHVARSNREMTTEPGVRRRLLSQLSYLLLQ